MALADKFAEYSAKKTSKCPLGLILDTLPKADRAALDKAFADNYPARLIVHALREEGYKTSTDSLYRHSKGLCKCPKE